MVSATGKIEERYGVEIERMGCDENHVHLLCGAHPKYAPGQLVRLFKSISGRELFKRHDWLKKELRGGEFWIDGYYVAMVEELGKWKVVEKYMRMQGEEPKEVQLKLW